FVQAEDGIRHFHVTGVQTCALPILLLCHVRDTCRSGGGHYAFSGRACHTHKAAREAVQTRCAEQEQPQPGESKEEAVEETARVRSEERRVGPEWRDRRRRETGRPAR